MIYEEVTSGSRTRRTLTGAARVLFALKIDGPLVVGLAGFFECCPSIPIIGARGGEKIFECGCFFLAAL